MKSKSTLLLPFIAALLFPVSGTAQSSATTDVPERWAFEFDGRHWELGYQTTEEQQSLREYVLSGETVDNWSELVSSLYAIGDYAPRTLFETFRHSMSAGCRSFHVTVLAETSDNIFFEWQHKGCHGHPAQHELRRITRGRHGTLSLAFVEKKKQLAEEKRTTWISIIRAARVRPDA